MSWTTWKTTTELYPWQRRAVEKLLRSRVGALFMEMGTGKTRTAIEFVYRRQRRVSNVVWFCPVSLKETVRQEILKHTTCSQADIYVFDDSTCQRSLPEAFWYIVGIESMSSSDRVTMAVNAIINSRSYVIVDESSYIKGPHARRTLRITRLAERARYRMILTGTPLTQGVVDLYAQMRFLSPKILGYRSFYSFAANHLEYHPDYKGMIVAVHNTNVLAAKVSPYAYQVTKEECLELPPKLHDVVYVSMTDRQAALYRRAKEEILLSVPDEELTDSYVIFRLFTALQQIVCGFWHRYPDPPRRPGWRARYWEAEDWEAWRRRWERRAPAELLEVEHRRLEALMGVVERVPAREKVVIWSTHHYCIAQIAGRLGEVYGPESVVQFHGQLNEAARNRELERWRREARFLVATQATGGHGLTLNEANHHVFYNNGFKYSERLQAEDRSHRIGQERPVTYVDIVCGGTIDERIRRALSEKQDVVQAFRRQVERMKDRGRAEIRKMMKEL